MVSGTLAHAAARTLPFLFFVGICHGSLLGMIDGHCLIPAEPWRTELIAASL